MKYFMTKELNRIPDFDDIVFKHRNREYGAFILRKKYSLNIIISLLIGIVIMSGAVLIPYFNARALVNHKHPTERQVEIKLQHFDQPHEIVVPPPPRQPQRENVIQESKYKAPIVVDSVKLYDTIQLMTVIEALNNIETVEVVELEEEVKEEVQEAKAEPEPEPFIRVEEMPEPTGGLAGLYKFIAENTIYPRMARENYIQGKVLVIFCVTSKGNIEQISILKSVDPELDAEAIRVVKKFPPFKPGKQYGKPVPVWYVVPFDFQL